MGLPSEMREALVGRSRNSIVAASPYEQQKLINSRNCTQEGVRAGVKAASIACVATAVPTHVYFIFWLGVLAFFGIELVACRKIPWAKANLNYTAQALIISAASIASYFITADKTILECARRNAQYRKSA